MPRFGLKISSPSVALVNKPRFYDSDILMMKLLFPGDIISDQLSLADQAVLVGDKPLKTNRASRMKLARADANLRAKAIAEAIGKSRGAVAINAGGIHHL